MSRDHRGVMTGIRWLLFIPGAVVVSFLAAFGVLMLGGLLVEHSIEAPGVAIPANAAQGFILVAGGSWIAPAENKRVPALVLLSLAIVLFSLALFWAVEDGLFEWWDTPSVLMALQDLAALVGAVFGYALAVSRL